MNKKIAAFLLSLSVLLIPTVILAAGDTQAVDFSKGLVQCDGPLLKSEIANNPNHLKECDFKAMLDQVQYLINWMFAIAIPISIAVFAYAGVLFMSGVEKNISKAKGIFSKVVWGFIIMCVAWLLVYTILNMLLRPNEGFSLLLGK